MLKNKLWIVALFAALTIAFFGCTNLGVDPDAAEEEEFTRVDLGEFNTIAGQPNQQKGWATNGYVDKDAGKTIEGVEYTIDDFKKAKYFVIETAQNAQGGMQIVWQSPNFPDDGWRTQKFDVLANNSNARPGVTKTGNDYGGQQIKVLLSEVFGASYNNYLAAEDNIRIVLQYYGSGSGTLADLDIQEAYLLISSEPVVGNTSLTGLLTAFGFGDTTIRNSANEYGWKFATKDKDGKLPKGIQDVAELRDATHLILVSAGGGIGGGNGSSALVGFEQLSVILEAGGSSFETILYKGDIAIPHANKVYFVIELAELVGYAHTIGAIVPADEITKIKPPAPTFGDPYGGYTAGGPKWKNVNVSLKYASAFENLGLTAGYLFEDDGTIDAAITGITAGKATLKYTNLGVDIGEYGHVISNPAIALYLAGKDLTLPSLMPTIHEKTGALGDFTATGGTHQFIWGFAGVDGGLDFDKLVGAKYIVIETMGGSDDTGFPGFQFVKQSNDNNYGWNGGGLWGDFISFSKTATDVVYIVIDLTMLPNWEDMVADATGGKLIIQSWPVSNIGITDAFLIPTANASDFAMSNFSDAVYQYTPTDGSPTTAAYGAFVTADTSMGTKLKALFGF